MRQSTADTADTGESRTPAAVRSRVARATLGDARPSLATVLAALALVPTAALTLARLRRNSPAGLPAVVRPAVPTLATLAAVVPALAFLGLGVAAERRTTRVAALALGVFPLLAVVGDAGAWLPAAGAVVAGGSVAVAVALADRADPVVVDAATRSHLAALSDLATLDLLRPAVVAVLGLLGVVCSLAGAAGVAPLTLLPVGATAAFATMAVLPAVRPADGLDLAVWLVAAVAVGWWATSAPFVAGAVTLVAFGAGQVPFVVLVAGIGGAVAATVAALRQRAYGPAVAALLLLFAGVPGRLPRAVAVVLALVVFVREWGTGRRREPAGGDARA